MAEDRVIAGVVKQRGLAGTRSAQGTPGRQKRHFKPAPPAKTPHADHLTICALPSRKCLPKVPGTFGRHFREGRAIGVVTCCWNVFSNAVGIYGGSAE